MNTYKYEVKLKVSVDAFDDADAFEALQETFGIGENGAVLVTECEYKEKR